MTLTEMKHGVREAKESCLRLWSHVLHGLISNCSGEKKIKPKHSTRKKNIPLRIITIEFEMYKTI